jgi:hypothetical protein
MAHSSLFRRWTRRLAKLSVFFLLGLTLLVGAVLLSVNLPPVSRLIAGRVNAALEPTFKGRLVLHRLGSIDFGGILGAELEVHDPEGRSVLYARDIDVRLFWPAVVWNALVTSPDPLVIPFDRIALHSLDVTVVDDGEGVPTLAHAFEPKEPPEEESSGGTELTIEDLVVETTRIRGAPDRRRSDAARGRREEWTPRHTRGPRTRRARAAAVTAGRHRVGETDGGHHLAIASGPCARTGRE